MKTKYLNKYISLPIILVLLISGIFPVGIHHASANGEPIIMANPRFEVRPNMDQVRGWEWIVGEALTLSVGGQEYTGKVGVAPWDPNQSYIEFNLAGIYDIQPGDYVSLSDASITKDTTVTDLDLSEVNIVLDTVGGKAAADSEVLLWAWDGSTNFYRTVTADGNGVWLVDFSGNDGQDRFDIEPGTWVDSQQVDEDGDATMSGATVRNPNFVVNPTSHWAYAWDWPADQDLTLSVRGFEEAVKNYSTGPFTSEAYFDLTDVELNADDTVSVSGAGITKTLVITDLTVALDVLNNTLSGTASPRGGVFACADNAPGNCRFATSDENGDWSMSPDPEGFVLAPGVFGWAAEGDEDGDMTRMDWHVPNPWITAHLNEDRVDTTGWELGMDVELTISQDGQLDYQTQQSPSPWQWDDSVGYANFDLGPDFILEPGQVVTISNGIVRKSLTVMDLYVETYDPIGKSVIGHSDAGVYVDVNVWADGGWQQVTADGSGLWEAKYDTSSGAFSPNTQGDVTAWDEDGDATMYYFNTGNIFAWPPSTIELQNCMNYREYTLTIDDPSNGEGVDYTDVRNAELGGDGIQVVALFPLTDFSIDPGDLITISSGHDVRSLVVRPMGSMTFDIEADTISGVNQPNGWMGIGTPAAWRNVQTDENGAWTIDYTAVGPTGEPSEDIYPGMTVCSFEFDSDGDFSAYCKSIPYPTSGSAVGEGWFVSPAGAYTVDPVFAGKAVIQFDAKYSKKTATLSGSVQFSIKRFSFASTSLEWLVIDGERMQLSGQGKINGKAGYSFMLSAAKDSPEVNGNDTVHIRIWETASGNVLYDNMPGVPDYVVPTTLLQGGEIILTP
jgi:hypothetical protein